MIFLQVISFSIWQKNYVEGWEVNLYVYLFLGSLLYLNLVLGNQNGFRNLTTQIQNLTSDVGLYRDEIISKIEVSFICTII